MKKIFPHPVLSAWLLVLWLFIQNSFGLGSIIMGACVGFVLPIVTEKFWPNIPKIRSIPKLVRYIAVFLWDVLVANIQVAFWILGPQENLRPRFLYVPLELTNKFTITVFASTISLTPGTVSSHISGDRKLLIVHCLNTDDDDATVREIKERYEKPLLEIFGC